MIVSHLIAHAFLHPRHAYDPPNAVSLPALPHMRTCRPHMLLQVVVGVCLRRCLFPDAATTIPNCGQTQSAATILSKAEPSPVCYKLQPTVSFRREREEKRGRYRGRKYSGEKRGAASHAVDAVTDVCHGCWVHWSERRVYI